MKFEERCGGYTRARLFLRRYSRMGAQDEDPGSRWERRGFISMRPGLGFPTDFGGRGIGNKSRIVWRVWKVVW